MTIIKIVAWISGLYISAYFTLHSLYVIISGTALIFMNLGHRKPGDMSAYSVFNKNFRRPAGSMDAEEMLFGHSKNKDRNERIFG